MRNVKWVLSVLALWILFSLSCQSNISIKTAQYAVNGQKLYTVHCENCHGAKGEGLGRLYPPLTDQKYFKENRELLACIVKWGMQGEITVHGEQYNDIMPPNPTLTNVEIAYILTYITTRFADEKDIYSQEEVNESLKSCIQK